MEPKPLPSDPTPPAASAPSQTIIVEQSRTALGRYGKFLVAALVFSICMNIGQRVAYRDYFTGGERIDERYHSGAKHALNKVAIIRIEGPILDGDGFVRRQIDAVREDEHVKAVVLRVDSPGGTVTAADYILHHLKKLRAKRELPLVVSMGGICASGGYYVSMAVGDEPRAIFAEPSTWTGSIGVIIPHYDISELLKSWHIEDDSVASHKFKQLGSPTRILSAEERAEERAILQALVDDSFNEFKDVVRYGRPMFRDDDAALDRVATGQIFTARQALKLELVDQLGFIDEAVDRAIELAHLSSDDVRVVEYESPPGSVLELLMGVKSNYATARNYDVARILEMTSPRAYYLATWLPAVLTNSRR